jgi:hypothetical protein
MDSIWESPRIKEYVLFAIGRTLGKSNALLNAGTLRQGRAMPGIDLGNNCKEMYQWCPSTPIA